MFSIIDGSLCQLWRSEVQYNLIGGGGTTEALIVLQLGHWRGLSTHRTPGLLGPQPNGTETSLLAIKHQQLLLKWSWPHRLKSYSSHSIITVVFMSRDCFRSDCAVQRIQPWPDAIFKTSKAWRQPIIPGTAMYGKKSFSYIIPATWTQLIWKTGQEKVLLRNALTTHLHGKIHFLFQMCLQGSKRIKPLGKFRF